MIEIDGKRIDVEIIRKDINNMYLRVIKGKVVVTCPYFMPEYKVYNFISSKKEWLRNALARSNRKASIIYDGGNVFYLFGKAYEIRYVKGNRSIDIIGNEIIVSSRTEDVSKLIPYIYQHSNDQVLKYGIYFLDKHISMLKDYGYDQYPLMDVKRLKGKWGVCYTRENRINLSSYLIHYPLEALEYVVVHEMAHFVVSNHSKRFYVVVGNRLPDYKNRIELLK